MAELSQNCLRRRPILVHIGLPKTGTTSLQELLFQKHPEIHYLGQTNIWSNDDAKFVLLGLLLGRPADYDNLLGNRVPDAARACVISDEALSFGQYMLRGQIWPIKSGHLETAKMIKQALGSVQILIILRNQKDWLVSWHRQGLKNARYFEPNFKKWLHGELLVSRDHFFELLEFDSLCTYYFDIFGRDNVHVEFYDDYVAQLEELAAKICKLIEIDEDIGRSLVSGNARNVTKKSFSRLPFGIHSYTRKQGTRKLLSLLPQKFRSSVKTLLSRDQRFQDPDEDDIKFISNRFRESNHKLSKLLLP